MSYFQSRAPGVVWRTDVDAVDLAGVGELEGLEHVVVLALDHYMGRLVITSVHRAERAEAGVDRLAEVGDRHERVDVALLADGPIHLVDREPRSVGVADLADRGLAVPNAEHLVCGAIRVVAKSDLRSGAHGVLREPNPLGEMRFEDQPECSLGSDAVDVGAQISPQGRVVDPREEPIELISLVQ